MNVMIDDKWSDVCQMSDLITVQGIGRVASHR